jgi:uncharacterized protein YhbP (UPF0306 family)
MADLRELLVDYVQAGKAMQLATLDERGDPYVCNLWFASSFEPDRLYFISRPNRHHCAYLRDRARVGGAVLAIELAGLGQVVRGVSFTGAAVELPVVGVDAPIATYVGRWPAAANAIDPARLAAGETHHRIYEIAVDSWILYDEEHFRADPRQVVEAR